MERCRYHAKLLRLCNGRHSIGHHGRRQAISVPSVDGGEECSGMEQRSDLKTACLKSSCLIQSLVESPRCRIRAMRVEMKTDDTLTEDREVTSVGFKIFIWMIK